MTVTRGKSSTSSSASKVGHTRLFAQEMTAEQTATVVVFPAAPPSSPIALKDPLGRMLYGIGDGGDLISRHTSAVCCPADGPAVRNYDVPVDVSLSDNVICEPPANRYTEGIPDQMLAMITDEGPEILEALSRKCSVIGK